MKVEMNDTRRYIDEASVANKKVEAREVKVEKEAPKTQESTEMENQKVKEIVEKMK